MKRSEAIKLLDKTIKDSIISNGEMVPAYNIEDIFKAIEELGMQPPAVKEPCETFALHQGKYIKTEDSFMFTHKWDQE